MQKIPGIGPLTATALIATVADVHSFKNGRQMSAWLGLVPRQLSSGGKPTLLGISKRGDAYLRTLLIHGARAAIIAAKRRTVGRERWLAKLLDRRHPNIAAVALANKNVRTYGRYWRMVGTLMPPTARSGLSHSRKSFQTTTEFPTSRSNHRLLRQSRSDGKTG